MWSLKAIPSGFFSEVEEHNDLTLTTILLLNGKSFVLIAHVKCKDNIKRSASYFAAKQSSCKIVQSLYRVPKFKASHLTFLLGKMTPCSR